MLEAVGVYNDLSPKLREQLEAKVLQFGKKVRYRFDIKRKNPDPEKTQGEWLYPFIYTLQPITFTIVDNLEDRKDKQKVKKIGIVESVDKDGKPERFRRVRVRQQEKGIVTFDMDKPEDIESVMYLELHPKLSGGQFKDKDKVAVATRIDEQATADQERKERSARKKAMDIAENMTDKEVIEFADAMSGSGEPKWESSQEISILRNEVEALAEKSPKFFNDLVASRSLKYQSIVKKAIDKGFIVYDPAEYKVMWESNNQILAILPPTGTKNWMEKFAEFLEAGGKKTDVIYKKLQSLTEEKAVTV